MLADHADTSADSNEGDDMIDDEQTRERAQLSAEAERRRKLADDEVCADCPIGGREGSGPRCLNVDRCDRECREQVAAMDAEKAEYATRPTTDQRAYTDAIESVGEPRVGECANLREQLDRSQARTAVLEQRLERIRQATNNGTEPIDWVTPCDEIATAIDIALMKWGTLARLSKMREECAEFIEAYDVWAAGDVTRRADVLDEAADVLITVLGVARTYRFGMNGAIARKLAKFNAAIKGGE